MNGWRSDGRTWSDQGFVQILPLDACWKWVTMVQNEDSCCCESSLSDTNECSRYRMRYYDGVLKWSSNSVEI